MQVRFFKDTSNNEEVNPLLSNADPTAHYAWCLNELIKGLNQATNDIERVNVMNHFANNMNKSTGTKKMLEEFGGLFVQLMKSDPLPSNEYIINCLKGMPVDKEKIYINLTVEKKRKA